MSCVYPRYAHEVRSLLHFDAWDWSPINSYDLSILMVFLSYEPKEVHEIKRSLEECSSCITHIPRCQNKESLHGKLWEISMSYYCLAWIGPDDALEFFKLDFKPCRIE